MPKLISQNEKEAVFEIEETVIKEETYSIDELNTRKTKLEARIAEADKAKLELDKINELISLL